MRKRVYIAGADAVEVDRTSEWVAVRREEYEDLIADAEPKRVLQGYFKGANTIQTIRHEELTQIANTRKAVESADAPKGDLISRQWLLDLYGDYIGDNGDTKYHVPLEVVRQNIKDAPSADAVSREDIIGYIDRVRNSGLGRNKALEYIRKYVERTESAEPNCGSCKHYEPKHDVCHAPELVKQVTSKLKKPCDSLLTDDSAECNEQKSKLESAEVAPRIDHDRDWIIGCIEHDGFIHTHRFDKANQIILEALSADTISREDTVTLNSPISIQADMVSVVRCKDCRWWQDNNGGYPHANCRWCETETPDADDYCSGGELADQTDYKLPGHDEVMEKLDNLKVR